MSNQDPKSSGTAPVQPSGPPDNAPAAKTRKGVGGVDLPPEFGGPSGPEPTRYGDWERNGRVSDF